MYQQLSAERYLQLLRNRINDFVEDLPVANEVDALVQVDEAPPHIFHATGILSQISELALMNLFSGLYILKLQYFFFYIFIFDYQILLH